jgi:hypothetical protein
MATNQNRYSYPVAGGPSVNLLFELVKNFSDPSIFNMDVSRSIEDDIVDGKAVSSTSVRYELPILTIPGGISPDSSGGAWTSGTDYTAYGEIRRGSLIIAYFNISDSLVPTLVISGTPDPTISSIEYVENALIVNWSANPGNSNIKVNYSHSPSSVKIYRFVGNSYGRLPISDYNPLTMEWSSQIPFDQMMRSRGFEYVETVRPIRVSGTSPIRNSSNSGYYATVDASSETYRECPGLYCDVWFPVSTDDRNPTGIPNYFTLSPKIIASAPALLETWYDSIIYPDQIPENLGGSEPSHLLSIGIIPYFKNVSDPVAFNMFKAFLGSIKVTLRKVYYVEYERDGPVEPNIETWSGSIEFGDQMLNIFSGIIPSSAFANKGRYTLKFEISTNAISFLTGVAPKTIWQDINVGKSRVAKRDVKVPFPTVPGSPEVSSMFAFYDNEIRIIKADNFQGIKCEYNPISKTSDNKSFFFLSIEEDTIWNEEPGSIPSVREIEVDTYAWNTGASLSSSSFDPIVIIDGKYYEKSNGPSQYDADHCRFGSKSVITEDDITLSTYRFIFSQVYGENPQPLGKVIGRVWSSASATIASGTYRWTAGNDIIGDGYFKMFFIMERNPVLSPVRSFIRPSDCEFISNQLRISQSAIEDIVPLHMGERLFDIVGYHSLPNRNFDNTPSKIVCDKFEIGGSGLRLSRRPNLDSFPVIPLYDNGALAPGIDITISSDGAISGFIPVAGKRLTIIYGARA